MSGRGSNGLMADWLKLLHIPHKAMSSHAVHDAERERECLPDLLWIVLLEAPDQFDQVLAGRIALILPRNFETYFETN